MTMTAAISNLVAFIGPVAWATLIVRARRYRHAAEAELAEVDDLLIRCNAEWLKAQAARRYHQRLAVTCYAPSHYGTEAPV